MKMSTHTKVERKICFSSPFSFFPSTFVFSFSGIISGLHVISIMNVCTISVIATVHIITVDLMTAQVLHVTNRGQSVQKCVKEGIKGRTVGLANSPHPCACGGDMGDTPLVTSSVFNEVVGLHFHNKQEYNLVVGHDFVDILGWQWSLHAMVLHIGATKNEGHVVVHVVFEDKWWLCDDTTVKGASPPPTPRKAIFLLYKRKPTNLLVPHMSQCASQRTGASALGNKGDAQSMPSDACVLSLALSPVLCPPPPPHAPPGPSRVGDRSMNTHAQSNRVDMCVAALAPLRHVCSDQQAITSVGANEPSSEFVEAVAQLLQKRKVRVARHLQVRVEAHPLQLRARHAKEWDERRVEHGTSQTSV